MKTPEVSEESWPRVTLGTYYEGINEPIPDVSPASNFRPDLLDDLLEEWPRITQGTTYNVGPKD